MASVLALPFRFSGGKKTRSQTPQHEPDYPTSAENVQNSSNLFC